jgi:RNA polymerase sigma factor (sigma-70 family)
MQPDDHLFRREAGRMVAALTRVFGVQNLALAEDAVQDAFCRAMEVWKFRGVPENPSAWLMAAAKNRALDILRRQRTARRFAPELGRLLQSEWTLAPMVEELFAPNAIKDDVLRMMFSCCQPRLPEEAQVALILHFLCGFSVGEIASAFVSTHAAFEKRITRAKGHLRHLRNCSTSPPLPSSQAAFPLSAEPSTCFQRGLPWRLSGDRSASRTLPGGPTAFRAAQLLKPPASRGVSDFRRRL